MYKIINLKGNIWCPHGLFYSVFHNKIPIKLDPTFSEWQLGPTNQSIKLKQPTLDLKQCLLNIMIVNDVWFREVFGGLSLLLCCGLEFFLDLFFVKGAKSKPPLDFCHIGNFDVQGMASDVVNEVFDVGLEGNFEDGDLIVLDNQVNFLNLSPIVVIMLRQNKRQKLLILISLEHLLLWPEIKMIILSFHGPGRTWCHRNYASELMRQLALKTECDGGAAWTAWAD